MFKKLIIYFFFFTIIFAEDTINEQLEKLEEGAPVQKEPQKVVITDIFQAIKLVYENNYKIQNAKYELMKADSNYLKTQSKYSWRVLGNVDSQKSKLPFNQQNIFSGTKIHNDMISAGVDKMFETGTYFKLEGSTTRFDSNAFEDASQTPAGFGALGIKPLYTGKLTATLSQDLLKNAFGIQEKNLQTTLRYQAEAARQEIAYNISALVVDTMVSYMLFLISENSVKTYERLSVNTKNIRDLTQRKTGLGLSENFEINQWNALLSQANNQLEQAKLQREENRKKLFRTLNITEDSDISNIKGFEEELPSMNYESDVQYAFQHRSDWKSIMIQKEIAELSMQSAKNNALPSLKVTGSYGAQSQNLESPQKNFLDSNKGIPSFKYTAAFGQINLAYPISDPGVRAGLRDSYIQSRQISLVEVDKKREIEDDIQNRIEAVTTSYKILKSSIETRKSSERFYYGLLSSFKRGRFTAVAVKNALDSLVQSELGEIQAKINYNIELLRYDLAKNAILEKFQINLNDENVSLR